MDLDIYLSGSLIAHTEPVSRGRKVRVVYQDAISQEYPPETCLLSCSIPVGYRSEPHAAHAFLEGLLPEGRALESMAARLAGVSLDASTGSPSFPYDTVALLGEYGRECAGAVGLVPRGDPPPGTGAHYLPLSSNEIGDMLGDLPSRPLGVDVTRDIRMSLAGAQPKLLLAFVDGKWMDPVSGAVSTHILKPTLRWPLSADNEGVVMSIARSLALTPSLSWVENFSGRRTFVAERFDRKHTEAGVIRLHQEDLCQATKTRPRDKYRIGHLSGSAVDLIRAHSSDPIADSRELFRQLAFRCVVGDEDGHGKNYGVLLDRGRVALAPLYDSLCTLAYSELSATMGTPVGRQTRLAKVDREALILEGRGFGFTDQETRELVELLALQILDAIEGLDFGLLDERAVEITTGIITQRITRLLSDQPMGEPETRWRLDESGSRTAARNLDQATMTDRSP